LSFLVYLMLFSMVALFCCHIVASLIIPALADMRKCQSMIALHIASDFFVRDIRAIKEDVNTWKKVSSKELIWRQDDHHIGWSCGDNHLERREGIYNGGWKGTKASIIAKELSNSVFTVQREHDCIRGVELLLAPACNMKKPIVCYAAIRQSEKT